MVEIRRAEIIVRDGIEWVVEGTHQVAKMQWEKHPENFLGSHCLECGFENPNINYGGGYREQLKERKLCFTCNHWTNYIERTDLLTSWKVDTERTRIVVNGHAYSFDTNQPFKDKSRGLLGYGGRVWWIYFPSSDTRVKTNDLWHGGEVPEHFRDRIRNNAEFLHVNSDGSYSHEWMNKY